MATLTHLVSHQDYCNYPGMRRLVRINEKESDITHFIEFVTNEQFQLIARVRHRQVDGKMMPQVEVAEDKIYYLAHHIQMDYDLGLPPAALPFPQLPNRDQIIGALTQRNVVVVHISIDHPFYQRLAEHKIPKHNKTYILIAPAPQVPLPSLHFTPSASSTHEPTPPDTPGSPALKLYYEPSLELDPEVLPKPTAYQEIPDL